MEYSGQVYQPTEVVIKVGQSEAKLLSNILVSYVIVSSVAGICGLVLVGTKLYDNDVFPEGINFYISILTLTIIRMILGVTLVVGNGEGRTWILYTWLGMVGFELVSFVVAIILRLSDGGRK